MTTTTTTTRRARDTERARVYSADHRLQTLLDNQHRTPTVRIAGSTLTVPSERKFADLPSIQRYVSQHLPLLGIKVRARKGTTRAHYEPNTNTIAIPVSATGRWAMRETVVLHECAHAVNRYHWPAHGQAFQHAFAILLSDVMSPEVGLIYRISLSDND